MIVYDFPQGSEAWEKIRKGKATASRFGDILTPKTLKISASAKKYAAQLACERLGIESPEPMPTYWMQYGIEAEEYALREFQQVTGLSVESVGFVMPSEDSYVGCSPDGMVTDGDSIVEVKCPKAETLVIYHANDTLPDEYRLQVQAQLWITGKRHCHFWAWHPQMNPFHCYVGRDEDVIEAFEEHVPKFLDDVSKLCGIIKSRPVPNDFQFADLSEELE